MVMCGRAGVFRPRLAESPQLLDLWLLPSKMNLFMAEKTYPRLFSLQGFIITASSALPASPDP